MSYASRIRSLISERYVDPGDAEVEEKLNANGKLRRMRDELVELLTDDSGNGTDPETVKEYLTHLYRSMGSVIYVDVEAASISRSVRVTVGLGGRTAAQSRPIATTGTNMSVTEALYYIEALQKATSLYSKSKSLLDKYIPAYQNAFPEFDYS